MEGSPKDSNENRKNLRVIEGGKKDIPDSEKKLSDGERELEEMSRDPGEDEFDFDDKPKED